MLDSSDTILIARPLYHCAVLTGEFLCGLMKGANIKFYSGAFNPMVIIKIWRENAITAFAATPTLLSMIARFMRQGEKTPLRHIVVSGECMNEVTGREIAAAFPETDIYHVYGLTEACPRVAYMPPKHFINGHTEYSEEDIENNVLKPTTATAFSEAWISANKCMVIHTHGSPRGLSGHENDDSQPPIISLDEIKLLSSNTNIDFVMITACQVAGGDAYNNVAYWMSKKINPNGIVIANKYYVVGGSTDFTASSGDCGWVVYQNGEIVRCEADIEPTLDMGKAYNIYTELTNIN